MKTIDARGLSCPQPVLLVKKGLSADENQYTVLVDNVASKENVTRFGMHQGFSVKVTDEGDEYRLLLTR